MMSYLPDDVLYMVCAQLWNQRDLHTLFNCACSGKRLAIIAVTYLYREQNKDVAPYDVEPSMSQQEILLIQRADLWRTIILSTLDKTLYPYSQYVRSLDLCQLEEVLIDYESLARFIPCQAFFQHELAQFRVELSVNIYFQRLDAVKTINRIGEAITKQTPVLEKLTGKVLSEELSRWIPRLPRLAYLELSHASLIKGNGTLIRLHCPSFKGLEIRNCNNASDSDQGLASFLNELHPQSLESFATFSNDKIGPESFQALSCHGESLIELRLNILCSNATSKVSLLKGCTNLVSLSLFGSELCPTENEKWWHEGGFLGMLAWLKECTKLRFLALNEAYSDPVLMVPFLLVNSIHLTSLHHEGYVTDKTKDFHQALADQTSLHSIRLEGGIDQYELETEVLVESLCKLINLTDLHLKDMSFDFVDQHIVQLARSLPKLEVWSTSGDRLTDAIWSEVASLKSLRNLDFDPLMYFTSEGIIDFIKKLGHGNKGLVLSMVVQYGDREFLPVEEELIQKVIANQVEGRFEYERRD